MSRPVASLGMYDHPAQHAANDRLWAELRRRLDARGIAAPENLDRTRSVEAIWDDQHLLFAQACGYPLVSDSRLALRVVGVPVYDVPDCGEGRHASYIVSRSQDGAANLADYCGRCAAINARHSNTGYNLFRAAIAPLAHGDRFFASVVETGSHRASIEAVLCGNADIAAIDAVTFAVLRRFEPAAITGLRVVSTTESSPTLPFVTARSTNIKTIAALRSALAEIVADQSLADARDTLFLTGIIPGGTDRFESVRGIEIAAIAAGYPVLQ